MQEVITETLTEVVKVLRFQDNHVWKAVERPRSLKAVHGNWFMGHWHVWAEKHAASRQYYYKIRTVEQAKAKAQRAYAFLEQVMQTKPELFLNRQFSKAGLALFEHIMYALADTHLMTLCIIIRRFVVTDKMFGNSTFCKTTPLPMKPIPSFYCQRPKRGHPCLPCATAKTTRRNCRPLGKPA